MLIILGTLMPEASARDIENMLTVQKYYKNDRILLAGNGKHVGHDHGDIGNDIDDLI